VPLWLCGRLRRSESQFPNLRFRDLSRSRNHEFEFASFHSLCSRELAATTAESVSRQETRKQRIASQSNTSRCESLTALQSWNLPRFYNEQIDKKVVAVLNWWGVGKHGEKIFLCRFFFVVSLFHSSREPWFLPRQPLHAQPARSRNENTAAAVTMTRSLYFVSSISDLDLIMVCL
jgi:hypothetical protein